MRGTLRCFDENVRSFYKRRFEEIAECIAQAFRCECEIEYTSSCPSLINNKTLLEKTKENLEELLGKENIISIKDTKSDLQGSEDFAYISQKVPSVTVAIAAGCKKDGHNYPLHNQSVTFDENALEVGCREGYILAYFACTRVTGSDIQFLYFRTLANLPSQGMLTSATA